MRVIDTHCHPHMGALMKHQEYMHLPVVCSTHPGDWDAVERYSPVAARCYGLHPWWVQNDSDEDELSSLLCARLEAEPRAFVGEIGLDGIRKDTLARQEAIFKRQLLIAAKIERPVTVHCVRAFGRLRAVLQEAERLPPAISMHSYGGSYEFGRDLFTLANKRSCQLFFGFSWAINGDRRKPHFDLIRALPDEAILLESDLENPELIDDHLEQASRMISQAKQWSLEHTAHVCEQNAVTFLGHIPRLNAAALIP